MLNADLDYAYQESVLEIQQKLPFREKMWGTGHAALCFKDIVREPFALINADDFYGRESFKVLYEFFNNKDYDTRGNVHAMVGFLLKNVVSPYGYVARGVCKVSSDGTLDSIIEKEKIVVEGDTIVCIREDEKLYLNKNSITSMNFWSFNTTIFNKLDNGFKEYYERIIERKEPNEEFYVSDFVGQLVSRGKITVKVLPTTEKWFGLTYKKDLPAASRVIGELIKKGLYPEKLWNG